MLIIILFQLQNLLNYENNENSMPQVSARISQELYDKCIQDYENMTIAINTGLEALFKSSENKMNSDEYKLNSNENSSGELKAIIEEKDARIGDIKLQVELLTEQLRKKDEQNASDEIRITELKENYQNRMEDFKKQMYSLDNQLRTKDDQIEKLNENMHKQAVHIQTLIQEMSQLNVKLLPESTKRPWWKIW